MKFQQLYNTNIILENGLTYVYYKYKYEINRPLLHIDPLSLSNERVIEHFFIHSM